jgi:serine protease Do
MTDHIFWRLRPWTHLLAMILVLVMCGSRFVLAQDEGLEGLEETAFKQAAALVDPSLVRIETVGGLEQLDDVLLASGPTSGVVVSADGLIISSSFNFVGKPTSILVTLADGRRFAAKQVANDRLRLLTLLKVDVDGLIPAKPAPRTELKVGQWALALGRTLDNSTPSLSVGIVSAVNRVWGKAIQTDAKTSPVNYGGALADIEGRVMGVISPLSPSGGGDAAGVEWYDGGIGFAIPLEDVYASLEELKRGTDLVPGLMGITFVGGQSLNVPAIVDRVRYNSPAQQAGLKTNDRIVGADGEQIVRVAQLKHIMGRKYAGEVVRIVVERSQGTVPLEIALVGQLVPYEIPCLGILPQRRTSTTEAEEPGVKIRLVLANTSAAMAGLVRGDRIVRFDELNVSDARGLSDLVGRRRPGDRARLTYFREGMEASVEVTLGSLPEGIVEELAAELIDVRPVAGAGAAEKQKPAEANGNQANDDLPAKESAPQAAAPQGGAGPKIGRFTTTLEGSDHDYWAYVPESAAGTQPLGLIIWIHPGGETMEATMFKEWKSICDRRGLILVGPKADKPAGWQPGEADFIKQLISHLRTTYTIDPSRIVLHSFGTGAGLAWMVGGKHRDLIRGVVVAGAPYLGQPMDNEPELRQQFFFVCGDGDPVFPKVKASVDGLRKLKFPVSFSTIKGSGAKYPEESAIEEIGRWVDSLDRI